MDNPKKLVSHTIDNMVLKLESYLLSKSEDSLKEFQKILDRTKRNITANRGKNSDLKRVYAVELEAKYNILAKMFNSIGIPDSEVLEKLKSEDWDNDRQFMWKQFSDIDPSDLFSKKQLDIFDEIDESDMKNNVYLGVDCTPTKTSTKIGSGKTDLNELRNALSK